MTVFTQLTGGNTVPERLEKARRIIERRLAHFRGDVRHLRGTLASRRAAYLVVVVSLVVAAGMGGYLIGSSSGEDLGAARQASAAAGEKEGAASGATEGYARGLKPGRTRGFAEAYPAAYEVAYLKELRKAGLDAPARVSVPDPRAGQGARR